MVRNFLWYLTPTIPQSGGDHKGAVETSIFQKRTLDHPTIHDLKAATEEFRKSVDRLQKQFRQLQQSSSGSYRRTGTASTIIKKKTSDKQRTETMKKMHDQEDTILDPRAGRTSQTNVVDDQIEQQQHKHVDVDQEVEKSAAGGAELQHEQEQVGHDDDHASGDGPRGEPPVQRPPAVSLSRRMLPSPPSSTHCMWGSCKARTRGRWRDPDGRCVKLAGRAATAHCQHWHWMQHSTTTRTTAASLLSLRSLARTRILLTLSLSLSLSCL